MEFKEQPAKTVFWRIVKYAYYAFCAFWLLFPLWFTAIVVPETTGFLKELGQELPWQTLWLIKYSLACGVICTISNVGFYFLIKNKTNVIKNNLFSLWVFITDVALVIWWVWAIFSPIYTHCGKMGE